MKMLATHFLVPIAVFLLPFVYFSVDFYSVAFPKSAFIFIITTISFFLIFWDLLRKGGLPIFKHPIFLALLGFLGVIFISAFFGANFTDSFWSSHSRMTGIITWLFYIMFMIILVVGYGADKKSWKVLFRALAFSLFVLSTVDILRGFDPSFSTEILGNSTYVGIYLVLGFLLSIVGFTLEESRSWRLFYILTFLVVFFHPLIFAFNPGQFFIGEARASSAVIKIAVVLIGVIYIAHKKLNNKKALFAIIFILLALFLVWGYGFSAILRGEGKISEIYLKESGPSRPIVWNMAMRGAKDRPLLGYGPENFNYVFQNNLDPEILKLENHAWFDRAHNFVLDIVISTGLVGLGFIFLIFVLVCWYSFTTYLIRGEFVFLFIPFILFLHFIQMQTSFETNTGLFLLFVSLSFLVANISGIKNYVLNKKQFTFAQVALSAFIILVFWFGIWVPIKENRVFAQIRNSPDFDYRMSRYKDLENIKHYPANMLRTLSVGYFEAATQNFDKITEEPQFKKLVQSEIKEIVALYEKHYHRHEKDYKYLTSYAILLTNAYIFDLDYLSQAEDLANRALSISEKYPHPWWVLAMKEYYDGNKQEASVFAKRALDLNTNIRTSKEILIFLELKNHKYVYPKPHFYVPGL